MAPASASSVSAVATPPPANVSLSVDSVASQASAALPVSALDQLITSLAATPSSVSALDRLINSLLGSPVRPASPPRITEVNPSAGVLAGKISERYDIELSDAYNIVSLAHQEAQARDVDPVLILSIIATESSFNHMAKSRAGAMGLMQAVPRYHQTKLDRLGMSRQDLYNPQKNIQVGTEILSEYMRLSNGNTASALQRYNGSLSDGSRKYSNKVFRAMTWLSGP